MNDVFIRLAELPPTVHGFTIEDPAGDFNIYIRKDDASSVQQKTLEHELKHIILGHFAGDCFKTAENCEAQIISENVDISTINRAKNRPFKRLFSNGR